MTKDDFNDIYIQSQCHLKPQNTRCFEACLKNRGLWQTYFGVAMETEHPKPTLKPLRIVFLFLLMLLVSPPPTLCSQGESNQKNDINERMELALIKDKDVDAIFIDGHKYRVDESTLIFDPLGKEIPICDLPVPCEAQVEFKNVEGLGPVVLRIEVRRLLENTDNKE